MVRYYVDAAIVTNHIPMVPIDAKCTILNFKYHIIYLYLKFKINEIHMIHKFLIIINNNGV